MSSRLVDQIADRIEVRGIEVLVFCGVLDEEQARRQPFLFDLDIYLDLSAAGASDDLTKTVNYGAIVDDMLEMLSNGRFELLEAMSAKVAELVLADPNAEAVTVTARKLRPPVAAHLASTGVRIHRTRA